MSEPFEQDVRYKRLEQFIHKASRDGDKLHEHSPGKRLGHQDLVRQALKDLRSIGLQLNRTFADQLPLVDDVPVRKVVQEK